MTAYILRRLLWFPFLLIIVSFVTFALGHYGPGDPVQVLMGQKNDPVVVERIRTERGLDRPFLTQYFSYVLGDPAVHNPEEPLPLQLVNYLFAERHPKRGGIIRGDFGESYNKAGQSVGELLPARIWVSVQLGVVSLAIGAIIGIVLGLIAAVNQGKKIDPIIVTSALFLSSLPVFILQPIIALVLARTLRLLPSAGWQTFCLIPSFSGDCLFDVVQPRFLIMPAMILALGPIGGFARLMRSSTLEVVNQDYIRTARAKGLGERRVRSDHITRNSILPLFTVIGLSIATLVEGGFIIETLFGVPGVGRLAFDAFFQRDYPIIMAMTLVVATAYIIANLLVDIGYTFLDPRIRLR